MPHEVRMTKEETKKPQADGKAEQKGSENKNKKLNEKTSGKMSSEQSNSARQKNPPSRDSGRSNVKQSTTKKTEEPKQEDKKKKLTKEEKEKEEQDRKKKEEMDKKKSEEEKKRLEEEAKIAEEQRKIDEEKRAEEEARRREEDEKNSAEGMYKETVERKQAKTILREKNLGAAEHRPEEDFFVKKDSSLKKNTAFVKKVKTLTEQQREPLSKEFDGLNLTKYIGEVATAIVEAKLRMADIPCAVHIASLMHQRYVDFAPQLLEAMQRTLPSLVKKEEKEKIQVSFDPKIRVALRLLAEIIVSGIFTEKEGLPVLNNLLSAILKSDKENHLNLPIITVFTKYCGEDFAGLLPRKNRILVEKFNLQLPTSEIFSQQVKNAYHSLLKDHFASLSKHLMKEHKSLKNQERQNRKMLQTKGELSEDRRTRFGEAQSAYQKLLMNASTFADLIDEDLPDLPEDEQDKNDLLTIDFMHPEQMVSDFDFEHSLWEDEDTRTFHENLIDLRTMVPAILFKNCEKPPVPESTAVTDEEMQKLEDDMKLMEVSEGSASQNSQEIITEGSTQEEEGTDLIMESLEEKDEAVEEEEADPTQEPEEEDEAVSNITMKVMLESFLQHLPNCINRDFIDKAAVDFCMNLNTKGNRRKLIRALVDVPRTRLDLLPFYSRFVATLHSCMPDIATGLVEKLKQNFRYHVRKKDQIHIESKIKAVRFIGELTKFKMFPKPETLLCLKQLLQDFRHHNIDMSCALLETCGRFLYRSTDSHLRIKFLLEVMIRKKNKLPLAERYTTMIENAFYYCNPPEMTKAEAKIRPPMHEYIRKLLFKDLSKVSIDKVLKQVRKLPWKDEPIKQYTTKCLHSVWNLKYNNIHCLASLISGLVRYQEDVGIHVVDATLEDIRAGMEINHPKFNQRRVSVVKFLGELYNYRMVESSVIIKALYTLIRFGINPDGTPSPLDPAEHLFRIRLVCTMLDTCGQFFDHGNSKKRLDCFLVYFQQYILQKRSLPVFKPDVHPFPLDVDNTIADTLETVRPKLKMYDSLTEANQAVAELQRDYMQKLSEIIPASQFALIQKQMNQDSDGLPSIAEVEENPSATSLTGGIGSILVEEEEEEEDEDEGEESDSQMDQDQDDEYGSAPNSQSQNTMEEEPMQHVEDTEDIAIESAGETEEEDTIAVIKGTPKLIECQEDEDFTSEFEKVLSDTFQQHKVDASKVPQMDIGVPVHIRGSQKKALNLPLQPFMGDEPTTMNFTLMTRKGNKQQFREFEVPLESNLVANIKNRQQVELVERQRMKELTLNINDRQEEEDYQEMLATMQRPATTVVPREPSKGHFSHPKGAPDVKDIFNAKGNRRW